MAKRLFVGGLPFATTEDELQKLFSEVGNVVSCKIIMDRYSGRSKGFGFVEYDSDEEAAEAINKFNDYELGGRKLAVNEARPMRENTGGGGGDRRNQY